MSMTASLAYTDKKEEMNVLLSVHSVIPKLILIKFALLNQCSREVKHPAKQTKAKIKGRCWGNPLFLSMETRDAFRALELSGILNTSNIMVSPAYLSNSVLNLILKSFMEVELHSADHNIDPPAGAGWSFTAYCSSLRELSIYSHLLISVL